MEKAVIASTIAFASAKGGAGKTVTAASIGTFLAGIGHKVLLIDCDAATNGLTLLYLDELIRAKEQFHNAKEKPLGIFEAGAAGPPLPFEVQEHLHLIPAAYVMRQTDGIADEDFSTILRQTLLRYGDAFDVVLLDAQAGSDLYARVCVENSDRVVIVSEFDPVSAEGVERLRDVFRKSLTSEKTWILYNKVLPELPSNLGEFLRIVRILSPLPWDADVGRAFAQRKLAVDLENGNAYTIAVVGITSTLLPNLSSSIEAWRERQEGLLRDPVANRLGDLEQELEGVESAIAETALELSYLSRRVVRTDLLGGMGVVVGLLGALALATSAPSLTIALLALAAATAAASSAAYYATSKRSRDMQRDLAARARTLERQWDDLRVELAKYRTLAQADFETLSKV